MKHWKWMLAAVLLAGCAEAPLETEPENTAWHVLEQATLVEKPGSENETGGLKEGQTVLVTETADGWGHVEDGWVRLNGTLEKIELTPADLDLAKDWTPTEDMDLYTRPDVFAQAGRVLQAGKTVKFSDAQKDQFGLVWGRMTDGDWVQVQKNDLAYFQEKKEEKKQEESKQAEKQEPTVIIQEVPVVQQPAYAGTFIFPDSDSRYLTQAEITGLSQSQLETARNEIYARHGRRFVTPRIQAYFDAQPWYNGTIAAENFSDTVFNAFENANIKLIHDWEVANGYL